MRNKKCDNLPRPHCHLTFTLVSLIDIYYNSYKGFLRYWGDIEMKYRVAIYNSDEGCSISVPGLPGCWSKGETEEEAIENIKIARVSCRGDGSPDTFSFIVIKNSFEAYFRGRSVSG